MYWGEEGQDVQCIRTNLGIMAGTGGARHQAAKARGGWSMPRRVRDLIEGMCPSVLLILSGIFPLGVAFWWALAAVEVSSTQLVVPGCSMMRNETSGTRSWWFEALSLCERTSI